MRKTGWKIRVKSSIASLPEINYTIIKALENGSSGVPVGKIRGRNAR